MSGAERPFSGWTPIQVFRSTPKPIVLWSRLGDVRFDAPFFDQTLSLALSRPLPKFLQRQTSIDELVEIAEREPARQPNGFIYHVSRCGSTLVSQMFARLPRMVVVSEAATFTTILDDPRLTRGERMRAFRALVRLYGRSSSREEIGYVIKLEPRNVFDAALIDEAYPEVPRLVLCRDPIEVIVSNRMQISAATFPGAIGPERLGSPPREITSVEDQAAFVISRVFAHCATLAGSPGTLVVDYRDLPAAVESQVAPHFGISLSKSDRETMRDTARFYAKDAGHSAEFVPDSTEKQEAADDSAHEWAAQHYEPHYQTLRRFRATPL